MGEKGVMDEAGGLGERSPYLQALASPLETPWQRVRGLGAAGGFPGCTPWCPVGATDVLLLVVTIIPGFGFMPFLSSAFPKA